MLYLKSRTGLFKHIILIPFITSVIVPLLIMDIWVEMYHRICFPLCRLPYVKRRNYIKIGDRGKLPYLGWRQKISCMYCGYANGVVHYWGEIAGQTEHYWCGIQHKKDARFLATEHQKDFSAYGDQEEFIRKYVSKK